MTRLRTLLAIVSPLVAVSPAANAESVTYIFTSPGLPLTKFDESAGAFMGVSRDELQQIQAWSFEIAIDTDRTPFALPDSTLYINGGSRALDGIADLPNGISQRSGDQLTQFQDYVFDGNPYVADPVVSFTTGSFVGIDGMLTFDDMAKIVDWDLTIPYNTFFGQYYEATPRITSIREPGFVTWRADAGGTWSTPGARSVEEVVVTPIPPAGLALGGGLLALFATRRAKQRG